ncbi:MAG TPA: hypothetical protein ENI87_05495, partial [bacterium]|nr:hypothetical protein [bacterium]
MSPARIAGRRGGDPRGRRARFSPVRPRGPGTGPRGNAMTRSVPSPSSPRAVAPSSSDGFKSSGQSPGRTLHLVGPGQVGRAFLRQFASRAGRAPRLVAVSDASGTVYDRGGLAPSELLAYKDGGGRLGELANAEAVPTELAIRVVAADVVVDATPSTLADTDAAVQRARAALQVAGALVLCSKNGLARCAAEWLSPRDRARVGMHAALGGTGANLVRELDELRRECREVALVGNVATTKVITAIERGRSLAEGIAEAQRCGFLEPDPALDLDGSDAAVKLLCVVGAVFGDTFTRPPALAAVKREDLRALDPELLRTRAARGATTRLVARATRGGDLRVTFEELPLGAPLAAPPDRVVYGYRLPAGLRVHTGL